MERERWFFRYVAGKYLGRFFDREPEAVTSLLEKLATDPEWQVREGAAWGMASLWESEADAPVPACYTRWLQDSRDFLRATAALSLVPVIKKQDPGLLPVLIPLLDRLISDESPVVRKLIGYQLVGRALADAFPDQAIECLQRWVQIPHPVTQWQIARALSGPLANNFPNEVMQILRNLQCREHPLVRGGITHALKRLVKSSNPEMALMTQKYAEELGVPVT